MSWKRRWRRLSTGARRTVQLVLVCALVALGVPVAAYVSLLATSGVYTVEAWAVEGRVLTAHVSTGSGDETIDMAFTVTGEDDEGTTGTCEVGRGNSADDDLFAIASNHEGGIVIPGQVTYTDNTGTTYTYTVTGIEAYAFSSGAGSSATGCSLSSVTIPASVQELGSYAFSCCTQLESVTFEEGDDGQSELAAIGSYAFARCSALEAIAIPAAVASIGTGAFRYCSSLASVTFDDVASSQLAALGMNAFACSEDEPGCLERITLPAGTDCIPSSCFAYQEQLGACTFLGTELNYIGTNAFYACASLEEFVIPELGGYSSSWQYCLATGAFEGCSSLAYLVFMGDVDEEGYEGYDDVFVETPALQKVAYWGTEYGTHAFGEDVDYYFSVSFYATADDAQDDDAEPISSIRVRDDVTVGELRAALAGSSQLDDEQVFSACGDEGMLPTQVEGNEGLASAYWAFEAGFVDDSAISASCYAYHDTCDDAGCYDIAACIISFPTTVFPMAGEAVDLSDSFAVTSPDGATQLTAGTEFTVYAVYHYTDADALDATVEDITCEDVSALDGAGSYTLWFVGVEEQGYTGSTSVDFTIVKTSASLYDYPNGNTAYRVVKEVYADAGAYTSVIVLSETDTCNAVTAQWLSAVFEAPIITIPEGVVPDTSSDNYIGAAINALIGDNAATIYVLGDTDCISVEQAEALEDTTNNESTVTRLSYTGAEAPAQVWRRVSQTQESGTTAYVVTDDNLAYAAVAAMASGGQADPIFICGEDGTLDSYTRFVLKTGHFADIVMVGAEGTGTDALEAQIGDAATYSTLAGSVQELSLALADEYYDAHKDTDSMTAVFASAQADDAAYAAMAATTALLNDCALFLFESQSELEAAVPESYLDEDVCTRTGTLVFFGMSSWVDAAKEYLATLWVADDDEEADDE